jgi:hypothetical protein
MLWNTKRPNCLVGSIHAGSSQLICVHSNHSNVRTLHLHNPRLKSAADVPARGNPWGCRLPCLAVRNIDVLGPRGATSALWLAVGGLPLLVMRDSYDLDALGSTVHAAVRRYCRRPDRPEGLLCVFWYRWWVYCRRRPSYFTFAIFDRFVLSSSGLEPAPVHAGELSRYSTRCHASMVGVRSW